MSDLKCFLNSSPSCLPISMSLTVCPFLILAVASPGSERKGVRKCAERVKAGLLIHLPSGAETQLWMHKRLWPGGKATGFGVWWLVILFGTILVNVNGSTWLQLQRFFFLFLLFNRHCQVCKTRKMWLVMCSGDYLIATSPVSLLHVAPYFLSNLYCPLLNEEIFFKCNWLSMADVSKALNIFVSFKYTAVSRLCFFLTNWVCSVFFFPGWREQRNYRSRRKKKCWRNNSSNSRKLLQVRSDCCWSFKIFIIWIQIVSDWSVYFASSDGPYRSSGRSCRRCHKPCPQCGSPPGLWDAGHASDRHGSTDGSASSQNTGRDRHCCAQLLQPIRCKPLKVRRAGEKEENAMAGKEGRGKIRFCVHPPVFFMLSFSFIQVVYTIVPLLHDVYHSVFHF